MAVLRLILCTIWQWTWGLPQNLAGAVLSLAIPGKHRLLRTAVVTEHKTGLGCFSLGMFIFVDVSPDGVRGGKIVTHEYGHTVQSLILGPIFLLLVGLPSVLWAWRYGKKTAEFHRKNIAYTSRWPENCASYLGEKVTGHSAQNW